jgi:hypothetical protein
MAILMCVGIIIPLGGYMAWFDQQHHYFDTTMAQGFFLWGRVSSFADCGRIHPTGEEVKVCPTDAIVDRTPPGNYIWHAKYVHQNINPIGGPVSRAGNNLLTSFAIHAVEAQPLDYVKDVVKGTLLSFGFPRISYPGAGTVYYYSFHVHYKTPTYNMLPPNLKSHEWIPGGTAYSDWLAYGHQQPGGVNKIFAYPLIAYQRVVFTWGPLLAVIFLIGLGGVVTVRRRGWKPTALRWQVRGTSMLPWITAVALLVAPVALADFDYRYLIPAIPFACIAAGLAFAPSRPKAGGGPPPASTGPEIEETVPDSVA